MRKQRYLPYGSHFGMRKTPLFTARQPLWHAKWPLNTAIYRTGATLALKMAAPACPGAAGALGRAVRACFGATRALKMAAPACPGAASALEKAALARCGAASALKIAVLARSGAPMRPK